MTDSESATLERAPDRGARAAVRGARPRQVRKHGSRVVAWRYGPRDAAVHRLLALADLSGIAAALSISLLLIADQPQQFAWGLATLPLWIVLFKAYGLYDRDVKRISHGTVDELPYLFHAVLLGSLMLFAYFRLAPPADIDLGALFAFAGVAILTVAASRAVARRSAVATLGPERALLIGDGERIETLARKMRAHQEYGVEPVGKIYRLSSSGTGLASGGLPNLDLEEAISRDEIERVVVAHEEFGEDMLVQLLRRCRELGVNVSVLPRFFDALGPSVEVDDVEGVTVLGMSPPVLHPSSRCMKRAMDVAGATLLVTLAAPVLALIAIAIKLDSRGPVLFRQERVGRRGRRFRMAKFRTMVPDAEQRRDALLADSRDPDWLLLEDDPRVTGSAASSAPRASTSCPSSGTCSRAR